MSFRTRKGVLLIMSRNNQQDKNNRVDVKQMILQNKKKNSINSKIEKSDPIILLLITAVSILTTVGIIFTLLIETFTFFQRVPFWEFFTRSKERRVGKRSGLGGQPTV